MIRRAVPTLGSDLLPESRPGWYDHVGLEECQGQPGQRCETKVSQHLAVVHRGRVRKSEVPQPERTNQPSGRKLNVSPDCLAEGKTVLILETCDICDRLTVFKLCLPPPYLTAVASRSRFAARGSTA